MTTRVSPAQLRRAPAASSEDGWPPNSYGLRYVGAACCQDDHDGCPRWWPCDTDWPGRGTRCDCDCHPWGGRSDEGVGA